VSLLGYSERNDVGTDKCTGKEMNMEQRRKGDSVTEERKSRVCRNCFNVEEREEEKEEERR
jgi:hypothetical protein